MLSISSQSIISNRSYIGSRFSLSICATIALLISIFTAHAHSQTIAGVGAYPVREQTLSAVPPSLSPAVSVVRASGLSLEVQGDVLLARGEYAAALDVLQQVQPKSATVVNKIGISYHHLFAMDKALYYYRKAVELNPHYAEAYNNLGAVYYGQRDFPLAEKAYKRALKYQPHSAGSYSNLGTLYFAEFKYKKGVQAYQRAFELDPQIFNHDRRRSIDEPASREQRMATAFYLAEVYAGAGRKDEALEALRRALTNGFADRKRLMEDKELASVRDLPEFHQMMVDMHLD